MEKYDKINPKIRSNKCLFQIIKHANNPITKFFTFILLL